MNWRLGDFVPRWRKPLAAYRQAQRLGCSVITVLINFVQLLSTLNLAIFA